MKKRLQAAINEPREPLRASYRGGSGEPREASVASLYRPAEGIGGKGERVSGCGMGQTFAFSGQPGSR
jgi:hypothetical protein